ncbi:hypothetical protein ABTL48_20965, partial [Acinetobacter baumannii]
MRRGRAVVTRRGDPRHASSLHRDSGASWCGITAHMRSVPDSARRSSFVRQRFVKTWRDAISSIPIRSSRTKW